MEKKDKIAIIGEGQVLYVNTQWHGIEKHIIVRVTDKQAISSNNGLKFRREINTDGSKRKYVLGVGGRDAYLETPEFETKYSRQQKIRRIVRLASELHKDSLEKLSEEKLNEILTVLQKYFF